MGESSKNVHIIGAGLSGLAAAYELEKANIGYHLYEAADHPGGRVWTDEKDGFLLDRGFQVFLSSYPTARVSFRYEKLHLKPFQSGALVWNGKKLLPFYNALQHVEKAVSTLTSPLATLRDKLLVLKLLMHCARSKTVTPDTEGRSTLTFLKQFGFSDTIINSFFKPFFQGVFLEPDLKTDAGYFRFLYNRFSSGKACLPANGMRALPKELASRLQPDAITYHKALRQIESDSLLFEDGSTVPFQSLIVATDRGTARSLLPEAFSDNEQTTHNAYTLYFSFQGLPPVKERVLTLNSSGKGLINTICFPSQLAPSYAPQGHSLCSVGLHPSVMNDSESGLSVKDRAQQELAEIFGDEAKEWTFLAEYHIPHALPRYILGGETFCLPPHMRLAGDYTTHPSIEGALLSGKNAAGYFIKQFS